MSCKQIPFAILMRLADGEMRGLQALRVRRHLKHCKGCTQTLSELGRVDRLVQQADYFLTESKHRAISLHPIGLVGSAALAAGVVVFFAMPGGPLRPTPSFAQVEEAMGKIKTVHWTETVEMHLAWAFNPKGEGKAVASNTTSTMVYDSWVEIPNPRMSHRVLSSSLGNPGVSLVVMEAGQVWEYSKDGAIPLYLKLPMQFFRNRTPTQMVMEHVILPKDDPGRTEHLEEENMVQTYSPWTQSEEERGGKKLLKFERTISRERKGQTARRNVTVWVDPVTMRVVRREEVQPGAKLGTVNYRQVAENFRYNEMPPEGTFVLPKPKVGERYRLIETWDKKMRANEQARKKVVEEAIQAYSHKDQAAFLALWDFDAVPQEKRAARQTQAHAFVTTQAPYKTWRAEKVMSALSGTPTYVRKSEADPFPPPQKERQDTVDVPVRGLVTTAMKSKPYPALATFTLTKRSGQWRIQQLQCTTEPLPVWSWGSNVR